MEKGTDHIINISLPPYFKLKLNAGIETNCQFTSARLFLQEENYRHVYWTISKDCKYQTDTHSPCAYGTVLLPERNNWSSG